MVRTNRLPPASAGVASVISSSLLRPSTLNVAPAWITNVPPSSRRRNRDTGVVAQLPELLAVEVVAAHLVGAPRHDLGALVILPHERRRPVTLFLAFDAPLLLARLRVEGDEIGLLLVVVDKVEPI